MFQLIIMGRGMLLRAVFARRRPCRGGAQTLHLITMKTPTRAASLAVVLLLAPLVLLTPLGCSSGSKFTPSGNPLLDLRNPELLERDRVAAARRAWAEVEQGVRVRERTRQALKNLAWSSATDAQLRLTVIDLLMSDTSPEGSADSRAMARLLLPTERSPEVIRIIADRAVRSGWTELTPALVRSYARPSPNVPDEDRDERRALLALRPGMSAEQIIFDVFLHPSRGIEDDRELAVLRLADRTRDDAWGLLARLDPDGELRRSYLATDSLMDASVEEQSRVMVADLRAAREELGVMPATAMELRWLSNLRHHTDPRNKDENAKWWAQTARGVAQLEATQRRGLALRNLEALRWASQNRPAWLALDRSALFAVAAERLSGRVHNKRKHEKGEDPRRERLGDWLELMTWGDLLTLLVVDDALANPIVSEQIFTQRELDKKDTSTEYGGVIETDPDTGWRALLYKPRARDRVSDQRFVASEDMFRFSDRSLAHYHFHVDKRNNNRYAGPSNADLVNSATSGRACLVFTSLSRDTLNVDLYFPTGAVIDMGPIIGVIPEN